MPEKVLSFIDDDFMRFSSLRENLVRIPEIYKIVSKAQKLWDQIPDLKSVSLHNIFYRPDEFFETHPEVLELICGLVQLGLLKRLKDQNFRYILMREQSVNNAALVHLQKLSFKKFVLQSSALQTLSLSPQKIRLIHPKNKVGPSYNLFCQTDCGLKKIGQSQDLNELVDEHLLGTEVLSLSWGKSYKLENLMSETGIKVQDYFTYDFSLNERLNKNEQMQII